MRHREHSRVDDVLLRAREQAYGVRYIPETSEMRANGCVGSLSKIKGRIPHPRLGVER